MFRDDLRFEPIDLARHADLCVAFRRDSAVCSFGSDEPFVQENGQRGERYLEWLAAGISEYPEGHVHVWSGSTIIGQMEMRTRPGPPPFGYVNLFYLVPDARGRGVGAALHEYALHFFRRAGVCAVKLSVSPSNARALAFYRRHEWRHVGERAGGAVRMMRLELAAAEGA